MFGKSRWWKESISKFMSLKWDGMAMKCAEHMKSVWFYKIATL